MRGKGEIIEATNKRSQHTEEGQPLFPYSAMFALSVGMLAHSVCFTAPMPYVAFMIVDFNMAPDLDRAGYAAGWITGTFMIGRMMSGLAWGILSDVYGRKSCLLASMVNVFVFGIAFGFSTNFAMAVVLRLAIGLGNGFMGIAKTSLSEICKTKEHEIRGFGYINGTWGLGLIVGPAVGGLLSRPAVQYPSLFASDALFGRFPYLLPCIVCGGIAFVAIITVFLFLPETGGGSKTIFPSIASKEEEAISTSSAHHQGVEMQQQVVAAGEYGWTIEKWKRSLVTYNPIQQEQEVEEEQGVEAKAPSLKMRENSSSSSASSELDEEVANGCTKLDVARTHQPSSTLELLQNKDTLFILGLYSVWCFIVTCIDESVPLWAVTSISQNGLFWTSGQVGALLATVGVMLIIFQLIVYEHLMKLFCSHGSVNTFNRLTLFGGVAACAMPYCASCAIFFRNDLTANEEAWFVRIVVSCIFVVFRVCATSAFSTLGIVVNASVGKNVRGTINGLVMTFGSLGNASGPILGSIVYASLVDSYKDGRGVFLFAGLLCISLGFVAKHHLVVPDEGLARS